VCSILKGFPIDVGADSHDSVKEIKVVEFLIQSVFRLSGFVEIESRTWDRDHSDVAT